MVNWTFQGKVVKEIKDFPKKYQKYEGFIYEITLDSGERYIGQKQLKVKNNRKIGLRELETYPDKRKIRKRKVKKGKDKGKWVYYEERFKEDWQEYIGSSDVVKQKVKDGMGYKKEILMFVKTKSLLNFYEMKEIVCTDCMEDENCLNDHVGVHFKHNIINKNK